MNKTFNVRWGTRLGKGGTKRESDNGRWEGLEIEICTTEQSKGGWLSIQLRPGHVKREDGATGRECECNGLSSQCCCVPVLHSVGTEMLLSDANELSVTSFSLLQMSICLHRVEKQADSGGTVSCDVTCVAEDD